MGTNTVLDDNPKLDTRDFFGSNPVRIVLDKSGKISENYHVKNNSQKQFLLQKVKFLIQLKIVSMKMLPLIPTLSHR